jgi:hypothetical protein
MTRIRRSLVLPCLALALAACGKASDDAHLDTGAAGAAAAATGGKQAGTYDYTEPDGICTAGGPDLAGATLNFPYGDASARPGAIEHVSFGTDKAGTNSADFGIAFDVTGSDGIPHSIRVDPRNGAGSGTATVTGKFPDYAAKVQGITADGVKVDAVLECIPPKK